MKELALSVALSLLITATGLFAYDRLVAKPAQTIGVVDVAEVYRLKEAEFATLITSSKTEEERQRALDLARDFARRLPAAMDELPRDCHCLVVLKSAVAGQTPNTRDLTVLLKTKLVQSR
jgi:hypothetical protein